MSERMWHEVVGGLPIFLDMLRLSLFKPEERRLSAEMNKLIAKNTELHGKTNVHCMMHAGKDYWKDGKPLSQSFDAKLFSHQLLVPEIEELLSDVRKVAMDAQLFRQLMFKVYSQANTIQEARDVTPECLMQFVPPCMKIPTFLNNNAFIFGSDERSKKQFDAFVPTMEMYATFHLLY